MAKFKDSGKKFEKLTETENLSNIHNQNNAIDQDLKQYKYLSDIKNPSYYSLWKGSFAYLISDIKK